MAMPMDGFFGFVAILLAMHNSKTTEIAAAVAAEVVLLAWLGSWRQNWLRWWL